MNINALLTTVTNRAYSLPLVILYVTEGCNMRCVMCSYRDPRPDEISLEEIEHLARRLVSLGLRHIVYSGGEPLMRRDFPGIVKIFEHYAVRQTLLTNGLLLGKRKEELHRRLSEIIISLDGPTADIHNAIRGVDSFDTIVEGIRAARKSGTAENLSLRCVVQKRNFRHLGPMISLAHSLNVDRISFLAADVLSGAFGRGNEDRSALRPDVILNEQESEEFREIIGETVITHKRSFDAGFVAESRDKLSRIHAYYEAILGKRPFPANECNAPMVSAVITSTGELQPCFFLPSFTSIREMPIDEAVNLPSIQSTREQVRKYSLERCKTCVCTLRVSPFNALQDKF